MKKTLRHITINNTTYNYITKDYELKIFHGNNKNEYVKVHFDLEEAKYPDALIFLGHFRTFQNGEEVVLNINLPSFVKQIILHLDIASLDFSLQKQNVYTNGLQLLEEIGYDLKGADLTK